MYCAMLENLDQFQPLEDSKIEMALKYAYYWYFRRQVIFRHIEEVGRGSFKRINAASLYDLLPNMDPDSDLIINGVLQNTPIVND